MNDWKKVQRVAIIAAFMYGVFTVLCNNYNLFEWNDTPRIWYAIAMCVAAWVISITE